jgi:hypothetical protein
MSVFISDFTTWTCVHDDAPGGSHQDTINPTTITYTTGMDGQPNHLFATINCPVCDSVSTHPVGGGAQPPLVQELFIHLALRDGCTCETGFAGARSTPYSAADVTAAHNHVKVHTEEMDGEGRWQVTAEQLQDTFGALV